MIRIRGAALLPAVVVLPLCALFACAVPSTHAGEGEGEGAAEGEGEGVAGEGEGVAGEGEGVAGEGEGEGGTALPGFGTISGDCGVLSSELLSPDPSTFENHIDFGTNGYVDADVDQLTAGGQTMESVGNAGGNSLQSEVFAFEVLARCEGASLLKTETQIVYDTQGKITDILVEIDGKKVGVSVTRAVHFPFGDPYTLDEATTLMTRKLSDIHVSTADVSAGDRWVKQILSIDAYDQQSADVAAQAIAGIDATTRGDTIVLITVTDGDDAFIY